MPRMRRTSQNRCKSNVNLARIQVDLARPCTPAARTLHVSNTDLARKNSRFNWGFSMLDCSHENRPQTSLRAEYWRCRKGCGAAHLACRGRSLPRSAPCWQPRRAAARRPCAAVLALQCPARGRRRRTGSLIVYRPPPVHAARVAPARPDGEATLLGGSPGRHLRARASLPGDPRTVRSGAGALPHGHGRASGRAACGGASSADDVCEARRTGADGPASATAGTQRACPCLVRIGSRPSDGGEASNAAARGGSGMIRPHERAGAGKEAGKPIARVSDAICSGRTKVLPWNTTAPSAIPGRLASPATLHGATRSSPWGSRL